MTPVFSHLTEAFRYTPPESARTARRILIKPNWGYPRPHPVTVSLPALHAIVSGIQEINPGAEILLVEGVCDKRPALEIARKLGLAELEARGVTFFDADALPCVAYPNTAVRPQRFSELYAPALLREVDCRLSVSCLKKTTLKEAVLISGPIKNLYGLLPRARYQARSPHSRGQLHRPDAQKIIADVYYTLGVLFDGAVVDATQKFVSRDWEPDIGAAIPCGTILFGDDLLTVDRAACELANEETPAYLAHIESMKRDAAGFPPAQAE